MKHTRAPLDRKAREDSPAPTRDTAGLRQDELSLVNGTGPREATVALRRAIVVGIACVALIAAAHVFYYFVRLVDDAFITLRYAERLVEGLGLTYNDGEHVEGFSNPTWLGLQALSILLGIDGVFATKLLSIGSLVGLFWAADRFGRVVLHLSPRGRLAIAFLIATSAYIVSWAMWGLETPLYLMLMLVCMTELHLLLMAPSKRRTVILAAVWVAFVATRPEAALYVIAWTFGVLVIEPRGNMRWQRWHTLLPAAGLAALVLVLLVGARWLYFGKILPQTYDAKQGTGFALDKLAPLWGQGAAPTEVIVALLGICACVALLWPRRDPPDPLRKPTEPTAKDATSSLLAMTLLANVIFVAGVRVDWMPNVRHLLPLWLCVFIGAGWAVDRLRPLWAVPVALSILVAGGYAFMIDSRYSPSDFGTHGRGEHWVKWKNADGWETATSAFVRTPPRHVESMSVHSLGMIDQLFRVLESSARPEGESWFIGRDIGMVGYYSDVQIFDTDGLFTPVLSQSDAWRTSGKITDDVLVAAFSKVPVATDLLGDISRALAAHPNLLDPYDILIGSRSSPIAVRPRAEKRPSPHEVLARYERVRAKFAQPFFIGTLYGENVGAAVEKRVEWVREQLHVVEPFVVDMAQVPNDLTGRASLDHGALHALGCRIEPTTQNRPALVCYWHRTGTPTRDWTIFVHVVDTHEHRVLNADHTPASGWLPVRDWPTGGVIRDAIVLHLSDTPTPLSVRFGLFEGDHRCTGTGDLDMQGRIIGPSF